MDNNIFSHSVNEKKFIEFLSNNEITTISFDIFDTLFFRKCGVPEAIFEIMGETDEIKDFFDSSFAFSLYRQNAEKNARKFHQAKEDITLAEIYEQLPISDEKKKYFKDIELKTEQNMLIINVQIEKWIDLAYSAGKKIILISDMYLNPLEIEKVALSKLKNKDKISKIYMSSEYGQTKITGNLFLTVLKELEIKPEELLHIGDNSRSDVLIPKCMGINTLYYGLNENEKEAIKYEQVYLKENTIKDGNFIRYLGMLQNPYEDSLEKFYFRLGSSVFGPILWEFCHWLHTVATRFEITQFNFIMREGAIFEKCFKILYPEFTTRLIYASRKSTNFLTLNPEDIGSVNFQTFRSITIGELYENFFIIIEDEDIKLYKNTPCKDANQIFINEVSLFIKVFDDIKTKSCNVKKQFTKQKQLLLLYLETMNVTYSSSFVDFGGSGTVFQRLKNILPKEKNPHTNILFYQHSQGYNRLSNQHIVSFLPYSQKSSSAIEALVRSPEFIEVLLNGEYETTINYTLNNNNVVKPNTYLPKCNEKELPLIIDSFWSGIDTFFKLTNLYDIKQNTYSSTKLSLILSRLIDLPTKEEVNFLGSLEHDEGNGTNNFYTIIDKEKISNIRKEGIDQFYKEFLLNPMKTQHLYPWIQGILTEFSPNYLISFYGIKENPNQKIINTLVQKIDTMKDNKIMIYGAGELFVQLLPYLKERNIDISAVIDSRADIKSFQVEGYEVISLNKALQNRNNITMIIASGVFSEIIKSKIKELTKEYQKNIVILDGEV